MRIAYDPRMICQKVLAEVKFDGMVSNSVFTWPVKAEGSAWLKLQIMQDSLAKYRKD